MEKVIHPTQTEIEFLTLGYNRFYDLFDEIMQESFWKEEATFRFYKLKELFTVYFELLKYPPIQWGIEIENRPNYSVVGKELMKFIRNVLFHFPFFEKWNDIWIKKSIVNLYTAKSQSVDRFCTKYEGRAELKYRFWEEKYKRMTYITINFPYNYSEDNKVFLKDIVSEKDGVRFSLIFMESILNTQIEDLGMEK